jgi:hypothetical protein
MWRTVKQNGKPVRGVDAKVQLPTRGRDFLNVFARSGSAIEYKHQSCSKHNEYTNV